MKTTLAHGLLALSCFALAVQGEGELSELELLRQELRQLREEVAKQRQELDRGEELQRRLQVSNLADFATRLDRLEATDFSHEGAMDSMWILLCGALVMFMHAGFAMLETGSCRAKNCQNVLMKNMVNVCVGTLGWWFTGWGFAYGAQGDGGFIGTTEFVGTGFLTFGDGEIQALEAGERQSKALNWFFQWAFCTAGATIVSGGVAERVKSPTYAFFAFCMAAFIYPVVAAWSWGGGWLSEVMDVGFMDFAGSGVVHLCGGTAALAGTVVLGPRTGRWETPEEFEPHNLPLVVLGTFALWFGWYGFNPGSTLAMHDKETGALAAQVAMNSTMSAAVGGMTVFLLRYGVLRKYDVGGLCNGILAGLVSVTAGCANMEAHSAVIVGFIGAFIYQLGSMALVKCKVDDPVDAVPVHGCCGAWACFAAALFDWGKGLDYFHGWSGFKCFQVEGQAGCMSGAAGNGLAAQLVLVLVVILWSGTLSTLCFVALRLTGLLRVNRDVEAEGIDTRQHSPAKAYSMPSDNQPQVLQA